MVKLTENRLESVEDIQFTLNDRNLTETLEEDEIVDASASVNAFADALRDRLEKKFPRAEIEIERKSANAEDPWFLRVNGLDPAQLNTHEMSLFDAIDEVANEVWEDFDWAVYRQ